MYNNNTASNKNILGNKLLSAGFIKLIFIVSLLLLAAVSYYTYQKNKDLTQKAELVNHTNIVKFYIEANLSNLKDAETGLRGYLLTKDSAFLEPYFLGKKNLPITLHNIDSLVADNQNQSTVFDTLKTLSNQRLLTLEKFNNNLLTIQAQYMVLLEGKAQMDKLRATTNKMIEEEDKLLEVRTQSLTKALSITPLITIVLSFLAIAVLCLSYIKILVDLKKAKQLQNQLAESKKVLENSNNELMQFAFVASHDLQEPLRKIQTFISRIAETEKNITDRGLDYFGRIDKSAKKMQQLILDILSYSRLNNQIHKPEKIDLNNVVYAAKYQLDELIIQKNATIKITNLPQVHVIKYQIEQVFFNLLANALKFTQTNVQPIITISAIIKTDAQIIHPLLQKGLSYQCISVTDNGIGFDAGHSEKIFNIFNKLHAKEAYDGNGIGLSIVKKTVEAHGGFVIAKSIKGEGATFEVFLPIQL